MKGSALVAALILIAIGTLLIGGYLFYISKESWMTKMTNDSIKALYIAEAGLERKLYEVKSGDYNNIAVTYFPDANDQESYYSVFVEGNTITSTGKYHLATRKIRQNVNIFNFWDLAVFSGGATAGQIAGNTQIRGTVYVLGEESFIDINGNGLYDDGVDTIVDENSNGIRDHLGVDDTAINGTGTFYIGNDYAQFGGSNAIPQTFLDRIPSITTLDAGVNVKYGKTVLGGSSQIGNESVPMDLVNCPDGFTPEDPTGKVFVEEGGLLYDRGMFSEGIRLPNLQDAVNGTTRMNYLRNNGLVLVPEVDIPENVTPVSSFTKTDGTNSFSMDGSGNMTINGIVFIDGNFTLDRYHGDRTINYSGKGSMVVNGNLGINVNLYTNETGVNAFPAHNIIGFMTPQNINLGAGSGSSNLEIMALFYAGGILRTMKQTSIAGAMVANHVDMSQNVPEVFQVKNIKDNLPPGMINIPPVVVPYSWREIFE